MGRLVFHINFVMKVNHCFTSVSQFVKIIILLVTPAPNIHNTDNGIGAKAFVTALTEDHIDNSELGFTFGGKIVLKRLLVEVKQ